MSRWNLEEQLDATNLHKCNDEILENIRTHDDHEDYDAHCVEYGAALCYKVDICDIPETHMLTRRSITYMVEMHVINAGSTTIMR